MERCSNNQTTLGISNIGKVCLVTKPFSDIQIHAEYEISGTD